MSNGNGNGNDGRTPSYKDIVAERDALAAENAGLRERISELEARIAAPVGEDAFVLRTGLTLDGKHFERGALLPFDPRQPPKGCSGFREGVHYERARVLVRAA